MDSAVAVQIRETQIRETQNNRNFCMGFTSSFLVDRVVWALFKTPPVFSVVDHQLRHAAINTDILTGYKAGCV